VIRTWQPEGIFAGHALVANKCINQGTLEGVTHVETTGNIGRGDDYTVGFAAFFGVCCKYFLIFPILLPFGFCDLGIVLLR